MKASIGVLFIIAILLVSVLLIIINKTEVPSFSYSNTLAENKLEYKYVYQKAINYLSSKGGFDDIHLWYCDEGKPVSIDQAKQEIESYLSKKGYTVSVDPLVPSSAYFRDDSGLYFVTESSRYFYYVNIIDSWVFNNYLTTNTISSALEDLNDHFNNVRCKITSNQTGPLLIGDCNEHLNQNGTLIKISCDDYNYMTNAPFRFSFLIWTSK